MQLVCYFAVIYQEFPSDSEVQNLTRLKRAVKSESRKVGKSAVGKIATQNTLIPTFRTFHQQKNVGLKLPNVYPSETDFCGVNSAPIALP